MQRNLTCHEDEPAADSDRCKVAAGLEHRSALGPLAGGPVIPPGGGLRVDLVRAERSTKQVYVPAAQAQHLEGHGTQRQETHEKWISFEPRDVPSS